MEEIKNYFVELNSINVNEHTEKKNNLTYLSWAWAWAEVKKLHADAFYTIYENAQGWNYHTDGRTCWVKTGVTLNNIEHIEYLPVMDYKNNSIALDRVTSFDVNKAIQRSLTKACARHGLGLYIYAGEDLPEEAPVKASNIAPVAPLSPEPTPAPEQPAVMPEMKAMDENVNQLMTTLDLELVPEPSAKDVKEMRAKIMGLQTQKELCAFCKDPQNREYEKYLWYKNACKDKKQDLKDKGLWSGK